jgi:Insertion element 4 transposase N-terminal/Transposase DDE domain
VPDYPACALPGDSPFPLSLIEEAVELTGCRERRRRLLPAAAVMMFVLGCCLFEGEGYGEVARKLAGQLAPLAARRWHVPGTAALARARRRLGEGPFEVLFTLVAGFLAGPGTPGAFAFGRLVATLDGTTLDVPHTPANIAVFGPPPRGGQAGGFPQARLVLLAGVGTRGLAAAAFGPRKGKDTSEQALARQIAASNATGPGMLVLADRNFCGHRVVSALTATGADVLIRAKSSQALPVVQALPDGSYRSILADPAASARRHARNGFRRRRGSTLPPDPITFEGIPVRVIEADITATPATGQPATTHYRLLTTLTDPATAPAAQITALYAQRWEAETGYRELKTFLRGPGRVLRSRDPAGIRQEIWALLTTGQLIHANRTHAAITGGHNPDRISYTITLRAIRRTITSTAPAPGPHTEALSCLLPPHRRPRSHPRLLRASTAKRRHARTTHTPTTTYNITINPPTPP